MTRRTNDPYNDSSPAAGAISCGARLIIFFLAITILFIALFAVYRRWETASINTLVMLEDAAVELNVAERFLLQNQLSTQRDALLSPAGSATEPVSMTVASGDPATRIADKLVAARALREDNRDLFLEYLRFYGLDADLHAGNFTLDPTLNIPQLADTLTGTIGGQIELNFLPGWRAEEMTNYLAVTQPANIDADQFLDIIYRRVPFDLSDYPFLGSLSADTSLEGYLFPDSYTVPRDADAAALIDLMLTRFGDKVTPTMRQQFGEKGLSVRDAVIIASIVQREAPIAAERPAVAGVYLNRIAQDMKLDADPTIQYAVGFDAASGSWWKSPLSANDLQIQSPYNTYLNNTLPPGPIANPGLASLEAVANPEQSNYLFFVASCANGEQGSHLFSATYEEHLVNVQNCR